jgi:hypothetical protein
MQPHRLLRWLGTACVATALFAGHAGRVHAQDNPAEVEVDPVDPDFKGAIGLGLIGTELGFVIPALAGARDAWAYIVFPIAGAAGGAAAGYFAIEQGTDSAELAVATLVTGMALIIPAMVITLSATAYDPDDELPAAANAAPPAMVRLEQNDVRLGAPAVALVEARPGREALVAGARPERQWRVSLFSGRF